MPNETTDPAPNDRRLRKLVAFCQRYRPVQIDMLDHEVKIHPAFAGPAVGGATLAEAIDNMPEAPGGEPLLDDPPT